MTFNYKVEITVKNDGLTRETGPDDLGAILLNGLEFVAFKWAIGLPWILALDVTPDAE